MDSKELFLRRISRLKPEDQILGAFIEGTVTGLAEEFKPAVLEAVLKAHPPPKSWVLFTKYPGLEWLRLMELAATTAVQEERISYEEAMRRMGSGSVRHVLRTSTGKAFSTLAGKDPHKVVSTTIISAKAFTRLGRAGLRKDRRPQLPVAPAARVHGACLDSRVLPGGGPVALRDHILINHGGGLRGARDGLRAPLRLVRRRRRDSNP